MRRKSRSSSYRPSATQTPPLNSPPPRKNGALFGVSYATLAVMVVIFLLGTGAGITLSTSSFNTENVVSRSVIDRSVPNPEFCIQYGASAVVSDLRVYMTFNPFSIYVTQPTMQPGCVIRRANWSILEQQSIVSADQVRECRNRRNTFGFTGNVEGSPQVSCVYQNDSAGNFFLDENKRFSPSPENDDF